MAETHPGVQNYGVLRGAVTKAFDKPDHFRLTVDAGDGTQFDVAINIRSQVGSGLDARVRYFVDHDFQPPALQPLLALADGLSPVDRAPGSLAFDYTLQPGLLTPEDMLILDPGTGVADNDLHNE